MYIYSFSDAENGTFDKGTSIYDPSKNIIFYDMFEDFDMTPDFPERSINFYYSVVVYKLHRPVWTIFSLQFLREKH